jgi:hypothetical protein
MRRKPRHSSATPAGCLVLAALPSLGISLYSVRDPVGAAGLLLALLVYVWVPLLAVWAVRHALQVHKRQSIARPVPVPAGPLTHQQTGFPASIHTGRTPIGHTLPTGHTHTSTSQATAPSTKRTRKAAYWGKQRIGWEDEQDVVHLDHEPAARLR